MAQRDYPWNDILIPQDYLSYPLAERHPTQKAITLAEYSESNYVAINTNPLWDAEGGKKPNATKHKLSPTEWSNNAK